MDHRGGKAGDAAVVFGVARDVRISADLFDLAGETVEQGSGAAEMVGDVAGLGAAPALAEEDFPLGVGDDGGVVIVGSSRRTAPGAVEPGRVKRHISVDIGLGPGCLVCNAFAQ